MVTSSRTVGLFVTLPLVWATLAGCSALTPPPANFCVPRVTVSPAIAHPGDTIAIQSDTKCDATRPADGWAVLAAPVGHPELGVQILVDDDFDGTFRVELTLPDDFRPGDAFAGVVNWDFAPCDDNGSCASPTGDFTVSP